ncbi:hypothetical protein [Caballeronia sp. TF1N1]|uniref:hypothetical protein n=1 Tax=Caballeronia sp. TF1N1 TaxID=2878153 RepID=UPI001FD392DA|nr:hypothetical protein [Caballeronia sp. TF1N1]
MTYRAAYALSDAASNGVDVVLTTQEHASLSGEELMAIAQQVAADNNVDGEIVIGDWIE